MEPTVVQLPGGGFQTAKNIVRTQTQPDSLDDLRKKRSEFEKSKAERIQKTEYWRGRCMERNLQRNAEGFSQEIV